MFHVITNVLKAILINKLSVLKGQIYIESSVSTESHDYPETGSCVWTVDETDVLPSLPRLEKKKTEYLNTQIQMTSQKSLKCVRLHVRQESQWITG